MECRVLPDPKGRICLAASGLTIFLSQVLSELLARDGNWLTREGDEKRKKGGMRRPSARCLSVARCCSFIDGGAPLDSFSSSIPFLEKDGKPEGEDDEGGES